MKKIKVKSCYVSSLIGKESVITHVDKNENGETIYCTDIPHPEDENTFLWLNESEIEHIGMTRNLKMVDGFNYPLCQIREDLIEGQSLIPIGSGHYLFVEPLPYRWWNPETEGEEDDNFEVYLDGKWQSAESIDFDFL